MSKIRKKLKWQYWFFFAVAMVTLAMANVLFGNPFSAYLAERGANKYIATHYEKLALKRQKVSYNFKDGDYIIFLEDKNSIDSKFTLAFDSLGRLRYDSYEERKFNTYVRFDRALHDYGVALGKQHGFIYDVNLSPAHDEDIESYLTIDAPIDFQHFPFPIEAQVLGYTESVDIEEGMRALQGLKKIMDTTDFRVKYYSMILIPEENRRDDGEAESWKEALSIYDIPEDVVKRGDLKALQAIKARGEEIKYK